MVNTPAKRYLFLGLSLSKAKKLPAEKLRFLGERKKALLMLNQTGGYL